MIYEDDEMVDETGEETESESPSRQSGTGTIALALLAGAAIGAAVALMMAPRTGQDMRRVIRKRRRGRQVRRRMERMG